MFVSLAGCEKGYLVKAGCCFIVLQCIFYLLEYIFRGYCYISKASYHGGGDFIAVSHAIAHEEILDFLLWEDVRSALEFLPPHDSWP